MNLWYGLWFIFVQLRSEIEGLLVKRRIGRNVLEVKTARQHENYCSRYHCPPAPLTFLSALICGLLWTDKWEGAQKRSYCSYKTPMFEELRTSIETICRRMASRCTLYFIKNGAVIKLGTTVILWSFNVRFVLAAHSEGCYIYIGKQIKKTG